MICNIKTIYDAGKIFSYQGTKLVFASADGSIRKSLAEFKLGVDMTEHPGKAGCYVGISVGMSGGRQESEVAAAPSPC